MLGSAVGARGGWGDLRARAQGVVPPRRGWQGGYATQTWGSVWVRAVGAEPPPTSRSEQRAQDVGAVPPARWVQDVVPPPPLFPPSPHSLSIKPCRFAGLTTLCFSPPALPTRCGSVPPSACPPPPLSPPTPLCSGLSSPPSSPSLLLLLCLSSFSCRSLKLP